MIGLLILLSTTVSLGFLFTKKNTFLLLMVIFLIGLMLVQYSSTKPTNFDRGKLTEMEKVEQIKRMNEYPPFAYRLANILEARQEAITYFKLEKNFVSIFDPAPIFGKIYMFLLLPFFLIGMANLVRDFPLSTTMMTLPQMALLTIIGHTNLYGPICLMPTIYTAILWGVYVSIKNRLTK